jgi:hypothetical protein
MFTRMRRIEWHGTRQESLELLHAVRLHCTCEIEQGRMLVTCAAHTMLARDQRAVDGLLFMRRMAERLLAEEFELNPSEPQTRAPRVSSVSSAILM